MTRHHRRAHLWAWLLLAPLVGLILVLAARSP